jgi:hypothetical protein
MSCSGLPFGFVPTEPDLLIHHTDDSTISHVQTACEKCLDEIKTTLQNNFVGVNMRMHGTAFPGRISLNIALKKDEPSFEAIKKYCADMEQVVSYPELTFLVRRFEE